MEECQGCKQVMLEPWIETCGLRFVSISGEVFTRDTTYFDMNTRCHDCGILNQRGNVHHVGCDMERCPKCEGQLISCRCADEVTFGIMQGRGNGA